MRYRSKPSEIEAVQWTGDNEGAVKRFAPHVVRREYTGDGVWHLQLLAGKDGAQKRVPVQVGHWIVRQPGDLTDHWPVDPDFFAAKYEPGGWRVSDMDAGAAMSDRLIEALRDEQSGGQPDKPEYIVGSSTDSAMRFLAVDRVATNEQPGGLECGKQPLSGTRRFMVTFPHSLTPWVVAQLGAYLTDDEWDDASQQRDDEIALRADSEVPS
jgi:hypothetical protein